MSAGPQSENQIVLSVQKDNILHLTLNDAPANALSAAMMTALRDAIIAAGKDDSVRVVVIGHAGQILSCGHDLKELTARRADADGGRAFFSDTFSLCSALMLAITRCPKPVIAVINGLATAAGCQMIATCDLAIATDKANFCTPGVNIGLFCSTPMVALSRNMHKKHAMEMLLTGETIEAGDAKDFGLINRIVPEDYLDQVVTKYARTIASKSPQAIKAGKLAFHAQAEMNLEQAYEHTTRVMTENMLADDAGEGIGALLENRTANWSKT